MGKDSQNYAAIDSAQVVKAAMGALPAEELKALSEESSALYKAYSEALKEQAGKTTDPKDREALATLGESFDPEIRKKPAVHGQLINRLHNMDLQTQGVQAGIESAQSASNLEQESTRTFDTYARAELENQTRLAAETAPRLEFAEPIQSLWSRKLSEEEVTSMAERRAEAAQKERDNKNNPERIAGWPAGMASGIGAVIMLVQELILSFIEPEKSVFNPKSPDNVAARYMDALKESRLTYNLMEKELGDVLTNETDPAQKKERLMGAVGTINICRPGSGINAAEGEAQIALAERVIDETLKLDSLSSEERKYLTTLKEEVGDNRTRLAGNAQRAEKYLVPHGFVDFSAVKGGESVDVTDNRSPSSTSRDPNLKPQITTIT